ncbi:MAG: efflux RND transporter periplasmic adaptor subunit [Betaproteobacteria bacterium]|nr:efflux RND transporter periplasmic adaptor subunit [Betaproteobacteria bacterium]
MAVAAGCTKNETVPPAPAVKAADPTLVKPNETVLSQITVAAVSSAPVRHSLRIPGSIEMNESRVAQLGANATGRVIDVRALRGQVVRAGDILAEVHSNELGSAQFSLLKAKAESDFMQRAVARARQLYDADVISLAELQRRENDLRIAMAQLRAAESQVRVLGMSRAEILKVEDSGEVHPSFFVKSTISGVVVERSVARGQVVQPSDNLFTIADLSTVWVVADVPEQDSSSMDEGQEVVIEIPALPGRKITAKLDYVADTVDPETRTVRVRTEVPNPDGHLKPEMLATLVIEGRAMDALVVPGEAVVHDAGNDYVFVDAGNGGFRITPVELSDEIAGMRTIKSGLTAGERIVTRGAFHLNGERKKEELGG